jgi:hypothetical protein
MSKISLRPLALNILILLQTVAYLTIGSKWAMPFICLIIMMVYHFCLPKSEYLKLKNLLSLLTLLKKNLKFFESSVLKSISLKLFYIPVWFSLMGCLGLVILVGGGVFGTQITGRNNVLYIPLILSCLTNLSFLISRRSKVIPYEFKKAFFKAYKLYPNSLKILLLSIYLVAFLLALGVFLVAYKSAAASFEWYHFEFNDKRIVYWSYQVFTIILLFVPFLIYAFKNPLLITSQALLTSFPASIRSVLKIGLVLGLSSLLWGPPWNISSLLNLPDMHEVGHLGSIQAINQGRVPFTEAEIQYGPGSQLFHYIYMKIEGLNLLSFRESCFFLHMLFSIFLLTILFAYLRFYQALFVLGLSLAGLSSILFFSFDYNGLPQGFFGWYNGFRYTAPVFLALCLWQVLYRSHYKKVHAFLSGLVYGFLCYMAQENLSCGIITLGLCLGFTLAIKKMTFKETLTLAANFCAGFILFWLPIVIYYSQLGQLSFFIERYFAFPSLVVQGFTNTDWSSGWWNPYFLGYILTPVFFIYIGIYTLYKRPLHKKIDFSAEEVKITFMLAASIALHQISLFRADDSHFKATLLALPVLYVLFGENLYRKKRYKEFIAFCGSIILIYPLNFSSISQVIHGSLKRYEQLSLSIINGNLLFFDKIGFPLPAQQRGASYTKLSFERFTQEMQSLKKLIGDRYTIILPFTGSMTASVYFFANLQVGTSLTESCHSLLNKKDRQRFLKQIEDNNFSCLIVEDLKSDEAKIFFRRFPQAIIKERFYEKPYYVLLA